MVLIYILLAGFSGAMLAFIFIIMSVLYNSRASGDFLSPFECGYSAMLLSRGPFSLRFFLLSVLFLIFDVEIAVLLPVVWSPAGPATLYLFPVGLFLVILMLGLIHEKREGSLAWQVM